MLVVILDWLAPLSFKFSPAFLFRALADAMARKLAKPQHSAQQLKISGAMSLVTHFVIWGIILLALLFAITNDPITQGVLLYCSLGYQDCAKQLQQIPKLLKNNQKRLSRSLLAEQCEFNTQKLSPLGINKLSVETLSQKFLSEWLMPIVLFIVIDGVAALLYRLLIESVKSWSVFAPATKDFGRFAHQLKYVLELIPSWILGVVFSAFKHTSGWFRLHKQLRKSWYATPYNSGSSLLFLSIIARGCKMEIAGPVMWEEIKISRAKINQGVSVNDDVISQLTAWVNSFRFAGIGFILILLLSVFLTR